MLTPSEAPKKARTLGTTHWWRCAPSVFPWMMCVAFWSLARAPGDRVPALAELTMLYLNLATVARLQRNPTVRAEIALWRG